MNKALDKLKRAAEENPLGALVVGGVVINAIAKLMNANTERRNSQAWNKEVNRRIVQGKNRR